MILVSVCLPCDALSQCLPSYLGFSYLGRGVSLHGCSSKARSLFVSKANHSVSWQSKSMPQPVTLKKLKLNSSIKTYKPSRTNTPKWCPFHYRGLECKSRKSRNTWNNRQIWPWSTEWSRAKANRALLRERTGHSKHPLPTTQEKTLHMDITRWSTPNQIDYILCSQKWRSSIQSAKTRPGADCGSDHELLITKFRLKLKKVGKTTRQSGMT